MVLVNGEDHHITDYQKRIKWQDTIFAWFAKWLQDDGSWWKEMYGEEKMYEVNNKKRLPLCAEVFAVNINMQNGNFLLAYCFLLVNNITS